MMIQIQIPDIRHRSQKQYTCIGIGRNWNVLETSSKRYGNVQVGVGVQNIYSSAVVLADEWPHFRSHHNIGNILKEVWQCSSWCSCSEYLLIHSNAWLHFRSHHNTTGTGYKPLFFFFITL